MVNGYCQNCKKIVPMRDVETVQLPNKRFIHRGKCTLPRCNQIIWKSIRPEHIIINRSGHKTPDRVYVGLRTPDRLKEDPNGQTLIKDGKEIKTEPKDGRIITVREKERENEETNDTRDRLSADRNIKR